jgi:starch synthase (maltosyl-transferring)
MPRESRTNASRGTRTPRGLPAAAPAGGATPKRLVVEDVRPRTPCYRHFAKAVQGERVRVSAVMFRDGHDPIDGRALLYAEGQQEPVDVAPLRPLGNDEWEAFVTPTSVGRHRIEVQGWTVRFGMSGPTLDVGSALDLTTSDPSPLWVDRERALVGAWYELFPRSYGGFKGVLQRVPELASLGFDVLYLPPIHPIGRTFRKGPNNTLEAGPDDPGSPWAIGSEEGGHTAIHPDLGTEDDLAALIAELEANGMELALDYALQCSPDHPWVAEHPEWFHHRPDGSIACAENPPKVYQDIYPLNFWPEPESERVAMWEACKAILDHWISFGVRIFRVDNPHTKPMAFWEWLIEQVQSEHPDVVFLAEAFTRPHVMARLAEAGFSQSYTYFTWRTERDGEEGLWAYMEELAHGPKADYMRPNFWPNTPDILSGPLRNGPPSAFALRYVLAATLSPSYGMYSGYELYENRPASPDNEEYLGSEKYQIVGRDFDRPGTLAPLIEAVNRIRRRHPAFSRLRSIHLHPTTNPNLFAYSKVSDDGDDRVLVVVNLDQWNPQDGMVDLERPDLRLPARGPYLVHDELSHETYTWSGDQAYVRLDPDVRAAHIFSLNLVDGV